MNNATAPHATASTLAAPIALLAQCAQASCFAVRKGELIMLNKIKTLQVQNSELQQKFERSESDVQRLIDLEDARIKEMQRLKDARIEEMQRLKDAHNEEMQRLKDETVALRYEMQKSEKAAKHELEEMRRFFEGELARIAHAGKEIYDERTALIEALCHQLQRLTRT